MKIRQIAALLGMSICLTISSQEPATYHESEADYVRAMDLYDKGQYTAAQVLFDQVNANAMDPYRDIAVNAEFYSARCAMHLFHKDSRERMVLFVHDHPESMHVRTAYFELASYYYQRKQFKNSLEWFDKVNLRDLDAEETTDYHFKRGYAQFKKKRYSESKVSFAHLIDTENRYYAPANYYHAHLSYTDGNYESALAGFRKLEDDESFATVVPYYITQILFLQEKYQEVVDYGPDKLSSGEVKKSYEVARIIGESYFKLQRYEEALPYLEQFQSSSAPKERQDHYQYGFAQYKVGQYETALASFTLASNEDDVMSQVSTYHMGECYLKLDNKTYARNAFKESSRYNHDQQLKEDALFNYAKLAYELSVNPFHEAIRAFEQYLKDYPSSFRRDEAYAFLLDVYLTTRDYQAALDALDKIEEKDNKAKTAYQLSAYNRGIELLTNNKLAAARGMFTKVDTYPMDPSLSALAKYWEADMLYREEKYLEAISAYKAFQTHGGSYDTPYFKEAYYSAGYAHFMLKDYPASASAFKLYLKAREGAEDKKINDSYLRLGDAAFVAKNYTQSISEYDKAIALDIVDSDYAEFQKARAQGFMDDKPSKLATLKRLVSEHPTSAYVVASKYQLGETYFAMENNDDAAGYFEDIIQNHSGSAYVKKSLLTMGLIHFRKAEYQAAIASFKNVVENYPQDMDSQEAQLRLQDVYVELGDMAAYNAWFEEYVPTGSVAQLDSVNYRSAERKYSEGNCDEAIPALTEYIKKFQPGIFGVHASYYLGECLYERGDAELALNNYLFIISEPTNKFTEPALFSAATISFEGEDYESALGHYQALERIADFQNNILEARIGQMRCHYQLGQYEEAIAFSDAVLIDDNTPESIKEQAQYIKAKVLLAQDDMDAALIELNAVDRSSSGAMGAEAKYHIARITYEREQYKDAEDEIFELIKDYPAEELWKIKAFILLGDVYIGMEDYFQAKATLQSIIDNVEDETIKEEAIAKYEAIIAIENGESEGVDEEMEIEVEVPESEETPEVEGQEEGTNGSTEEE